MRNRRPQTKRLLLRIGGLHAAAIILLLVLIASIGGSGLRTAAQGDATATPLPLYALPDARLNRARHSGVMAVVSDGRTVVTANMINDTASIARPGQGQLVAEIPVGHDPRGVAITSNDEIAVVTNRNDGTLSVISIADARVTDTIDLGGAFPYGVVIEDNQTAYVSLMGSDEIAVVDLIAKTVVQRIDVPPAPAGLALWGGFLYVSHFWTGDLSLVYLPQSRVIQTVPMNMDVGVSQAVELDITRGLAYMPASRSFSRNMALTYDSAVFPVVNVIDLRGNAPQRGAQIALDTADRPVNLPFAAALDRFSERLYVTNAGSNSVSVIDLNTGEARAHIPVGSNPRGVLLNRDNTLLYVYNALDATITTLQTSDLDVVSTLPVSNLTISIDLLLGEQLFFGTSDERLSRGNWISCANCHFDGLSDGRVWAGFPNGGRNTPLLFALPETPPYNWSGTWSELADMEYKIRWLQGGTGLIDSTLPPTLEDLHNPLIESDLTLLTTYLTSLQPPAADPPADARMAARGQAVFDAQDCASCHVGAVGTNLQPYDVGTGGTFDTPSLRWLAWSAPYFHDGSARTLREVFERDGMHQMIYALSAEDVDALVIYLLSLPQQ